MKTIHKISQEGRTITYEIRDGSKVIAQGVKTVPVGYDRLLIPSLDGTPALSLSL